MPQARISEASYYLWRNKFGGMEVSDAKRLRALEAENARLKKLLAESMLENEVTREALRKKVIGAPARRELVLYPGCQNLDVSGPYEVFAGANRYLTTAGQKPVYALTAESRIAE
jgi:hypothetical protein